MRLPLLAATTLALALGLLATGCGSSDSSSTSATAATTVPSGRLGNHERCPYMLDGEQVVARSCPPVQLMTGDEWEAAGSNIGWKFVVWSRVTSISSSSGVVSVRCPPSSYPDISFDRSVIHGYAGVVATVPISTGQREFDYTRELGFSARLKDVSPTPAKVQFWARCQS